MPACSCANRDGQLAVSNCPCIQHVGRTEPRVLVLYAGGTIGMTLKDGVYSPEPRFLEAAMRRQPSLHDPDYLIETTTTTTTTTTPTLFLALPLSRSRTHVLYEIREYEPLIDSSNSSAEDWSRLAGDIEASHDDFDGFVVVHGTDTMAYAASALSFLLEALDKPVVFTGALVPICEPRGDAVGNLVDALTAAGVMKVSEVCICLDRKLLRGNRSTKVSTDRFDAIESPNLAPLATFGIEVELGVEAVERAPGTGQFRAHKSFCCKLAILQLFPSIPGEMVAAALRPPTEGVVLLTYGTGNAPDNRPEILELLREAVKRGVIVVNVTHCIRGRVGRNYAVSTALADSGVIAGADLTTEAALTKLGYVLSKSEWSLEEKRRAVALDIRGEMTPEAST